MGFITQLIRRVEKILVGSEGTRPGIPLAGTNHVRDAADWEQNDIYKGELAHDLDGGRLFTSDSVEPIEVNTEDAILSGLTLQNSGVSSRYLGVTEGSIRLNGRTYYHTPPSDVSDTSIYIDANATGYGRVDSIYAEGDLDVFDSIADMYAVKFTVAKGLPAADPSPAPIPEGTLLVGMCYVPPQSLGITVLYPLSVSRGTSSRFPLFAESTTSFVEKAKSEVWDWTTYVLLFNGQVVKFGDSLYRAGITHQSDSTDILTDMMDGKIVDIGHTTDETVDRFSHVGLTPTDGSWTDGAFDWNSTTRILDAFDAINERMEMLGPIAPDDISAASLIVTAPTEFSARSRTDGSVTSNVIDGLVEVTIETADWFSPADAGTIRAEIGADVTTEITLTETTHPPATIDTVTGTDVTLSITKNDFYAGVEDKEGFYNALQADIVWDVPSMGTPPTLGAEQVVDLVYTGTDLIETTMTTSVYFDDLSVVPTISALGGVLAYWGGKYISGVPVLDVADTIEFDFTADDTVTEFFNSTKIVSVTSSQMTDTDLAYDSAYQAAALPFTSGQALTFTDVQIEIDPDAADGLVAFVVTPYKANGDAGTPTTETTEYLVDTNVEEGVRLTSGAGEFPIAGYGVAYNSAQSAQSLVTVGNQELQYTLGSFKYPSTDYSGWAIEDNFGNPITPPDYSGATGIRWATFNLGTITAKRFVKLMVTDAIGFSEDYADGVSMTTDLYFYVKVEGVTGWIDGNKAYDSGNPSADGDEALDARNSTPTIRRVTFGSTSRTGTLYVRVGLPAGSTKQFGGVTLMSNPDSSAGDAYMPVSLYDAEAESNTIYYSIDEGAVVYKDTFGVVKPLTFDS